MIAVTSILVGIVILAVVIYGIFIYNYLVQLKNNVSNAWANIDVLLKQRMDEIPKLVMVCREYMKYEQPTLEQITQARTQINQGRQEINPGKIGAGEGFLQKALAGLFAVAENYPDLKANQHFLQLQARISSLESQLSHKREYYNDCVNAYNIRIEQFPDMLVASLFKYGPQALLQIPKVETQDIHLDRLFANER